MTPKHADEIIKQHKSVVASVIEKSGGRNVICNWWRGDPKKLGILLHGAVIFSEGALCEELDFLFEIALTKREMALENK